MHSDAASICDTIINELNTFRNAEYTKGNRKDVKNIVCDNKLAKLAEKAASPFTLEEAPRPEEGQDKNKYRSKNMVMIKRTIVITPSDQQLMDAGLTEPTFPEEPKAGAKETAESAKKRREAEKLMKANNAERDKRWARNKSNYAKHAFATWKARDYSSEDAYTLMMFDRNEKLGMAVARSSKKLMTKGGKMMYKVYIIAMFQYQEDKELNKLDLNQHVELAQYYGFHTPSPTKSDWDAADIQSFLDENKDLTAEAKDFPEVVGAQLVYDRFLAENELNQFKIDEKVRMKILNKFHEETAQKYFDDFPAVRNYIRGIAIQFCMAKDFKRYSKELTRDTICRNQVSSHTGILTELLHCAAEALADRGLKAGGGEPGLQLGQPTIETGYYNIDEYSTSSYEAADLPMAALLVREMCFYDGDEYRVITDQIRDLLKRDNLPETGDDGRRIPDIFFERWETIRRSIQEDVQLALDGFNTAKQPDKGTRSLWIENRLLDACRLLEPLDGKLQSNELNRDNIICKGDGDAVPHLVDLFKCAKDLADTWGAKTAKDFRRPTKQEIEDGYVRDKVTFPSFARALARKFCKTHDKSNSGLDALGHAIVEKRGQNGAYNGMEEKIREAAEADDFHFAIGCGDVLTRAINAGKPPADAVKTKDTKGVELKATVLKRLVAVEAEAKKIHAKLEELAAAVFGDDKDEEKHAHAKKIVHESFRYCIKRNQYSYETITKKNVCERKKVNVQIINLLKCARNVANNVGKVYQFDDQINYAYTLVRVFCHKNSSVGTKMQNWGMFRLIKSKKGIMDDFAVFMNDLTIAARPLDLKG